MNKYSDPTLKDNLPYALLPVESFNKITWRGGDDALSALSTVDPGLYFGEFRSMLGLEKTDKRDAIIFPVLPWSVVTRKSRAETYKRYSTTEMFFRPITARNRFVKYEKDVKGQRTKNDKGRNVIVASSLKFPGKGSGFDPQKEVFGMVFDASGNMKAYACLVLDAWSSYISYNNAAMIYERGKHADNTMPIYCIGTRGTPDGNRKAITYNGFSSVEIEALDVPAKMFFTIDQAFESLWDAAQAWAICPRWHSETSATVELVLPPMPANVPFSDPTEEIPDFMSDEIVDGSQF